MRVLLLGTGSADGWPNAWCTCASCEAARHDGDTRTSTAALVDGRLLLELGPDTAAQVARRGASLADVRTVLVTHAHHDHLAPQLLLARHWAGRTEPLTLIGPPQVIDACRPWLAPHDPVSLVAVGPGDVLDVDGYQVRVIASTHDVDADVLTSDAVLYDVTGPDGSRLLHACDTGPFDDEMLHAVADAAFDLVLLEETFGDVSDHGTGHLDLTTFPRVLADLRACGAVTEATDVVAVHLSHHNPPAPELARRLASWGARIVPDLSVLGGTPERRPAPPRRSLVLGGARSGKSREAERRLADVRDVTYVATGGRRDDDPDWQRRVDQHRARRPASWTTVETYDVATVLCEAGPDDCLLVDCLSLWLAAQLDRSGVWDAAPDDAAHDERLSAVEREVRRLVDALRRTRAQVVVVSNEVGSGVVPAHSSGRIYRDLLGALNAGVAAACDDVSLVVAGRVVPL